MKVLVTGVVPPGAGGMRDYGDLLAGGLAARGVDATCTWIEADERSASSWLSAAVRAVHAAIRSNHDAVVWNHTPLAASWRGVPGPAVLAPLVWRLRRRTVVVVVHEVSQPWRGRGVVGSARAVVQLAALVPVLMAADGVVGTTAARQRRLQQWIRRRPVVFLPVFSNFAPPRPVPAAAASPPDGGFRVAVVDHGADFARPDLACQALAALGAGVEVVLLGAPGPGTAAAARWQAAVEAAGLAAPLRWTGIVDRGAFRDTLLAADAVLVVNELGPSTRKGTLAAAVAHGRPVVCLDGPQRWQPLVDGGAVLVAAAAAGLAEHLTTLRASVERRREAGAAAARFYDERMSLDVAVDGVRQLLADPGTGRSDSE